jgi:hypothetical protein
MTEIRPEETPMSQTTAPSADIRRLVADTIDPAAADYLADDPTVTMLDDDALSLGDPTEDGTVTIRPDDTVTVWATGTIAATARIPGAYEHYAANVR